MMMSIRLTRRQAVRILGMGAGAGVAAALTGTEGWLGVFAQVRTPAAKKVTFPKGAIIRTILKDLSPESLATGPLLFHEHLSYRPAAATQHFTDDVALMIEEVKAAGKDGIACIVDGGHADMARSIDALRRIATESGIAIVASGGYYLQRTYPPEIATMSADEIAGVLIRESAAQRWGAFGEIGQQGGEMTPDERKVFQAVGKAQARTGIPIFTHNAYLGARPTTPPVPKDSALRQLDVLEAAGAKPQHVAIGHVCCLDDPKAEVPQQLAKRGAFVGFDRVTIPIVPDAQKAATIMAMVEAGCADKLLVSSDFYNERSLRKSGGAGVGQAVSVIGPMLLKAGMSEALLHSILVDNPRRFLAFQPKNA